VTRPGLAHHNPVEALMQTRSYPTRPPTPGVPAPEPALHLLHGLWVASCATCGFQLASARDQARCERRAARRRCPICHLDGR
jgi:hypothetical protein